MLCCALEPEHLADVAFRMTGMLENVKLRINSPLQEQEQSK